MESTYISVTDTAKILRKELAKAFPGVVFSVVSKSYSGGASINIGWTDGPTTEMVDAVTKKFEGATFDGMIDLKSYCVSDYNGQKVHFGADYIFNNRKYSRESLVKAIEFTTTKYGFLPPCIKENNWKGHISYELSGEQASHRPFNGSFDSVADLINREMWKMNFYAQAR